MSILIKGMDMPISCEKCPLCYDYLCCSIDNSLHMFLYNRHPGCPLIEIPTPHGRLIDASELDKCWEEKEDISEDVDYKILYKCVLAISKYAPTILEAEK